MKNKEKYVSYDATGIAKAYSKYLETKEAFDRAEEQLKDQFFRSNCEWDKDSREDMFEYDFVVIDATDHEIAFQIVAQSFRDDDNLEVYEPQVGEDNYSVTKDSILIFIN